MIRSFFGLLMVVAVLGWGGPAFASDGRYGLLLQQQQDRLNLDVRQGIGIPRAGLSARDSRRVDQLQFEQRSQLQLLEGQQRAREQLLGHHRHSLPPGRGQAEADLRHQMFAHERQLQTQRFELERQRLLQSIRPQPLQPTPAPGQLSLP